MRLAAAILAGQNSHQDRDGRSVGCRRCAGLVSFPGLLKKSRVSAAVGLLDEGLVGAMGRAACRLPSWSQTEACASSLGMRIRL